MSLHYVNQARGIILQNIVNKTAPQNLVLFLWKNDRTPTDADTESDYTVATFTGYAPVTLTGASWTVTDGNPGIASYAQQTFTSSADQALQTIYGAGLKQVTSGKLIAVERFSVPQNISKNGETLKVTPVLNDN